jgi:hypothetical protein
LAINLAPADAGELAAVVLVWGKNFEMVLACSYEHIVKRRTFKAKTSAGAIMSNNPALQSFITPAVRALVRRRLTKSVALVTENSQMGDQEKLDAKIALLLVHEVNPFQEFYPAEHALVKGVHLDTLNSGDKRRSKPLTL